ncbi:Oidioi.mRNA.OKI2018_I69.chr1.g534.t1.cds [Oikopleura dioica]|uniref:Oidioi.mRNA.OKI2018_I69.chr1.g528.t1.cds n=1 Tax=Oikopleura dioica TaxID=34765 RepID=A0ABN7SQ68_OIKDI|nr:Oidioi.mRNA.OKI2018_I69.chr1.g528.t1.cds [Oikopleura dioica]CAG5102931.1 Oidioi.mRNA.OKI2018_I69.chr1.g534.t1.cds [Oikopleura dioica]
MQIQFFMYPNTVPQQGQQQQPYPTATYTGAPGYGAPQPAPTYAQQPAPASAFAPPPTPSPAPSPQPVILNIQQNAPQTLAAPQPIRPALSQQSLRNPSPQPPVIMPQQRKPDNSARNFILGVICCPVISFGILIIVAIISVAINGPSSGSCGGPNGPPCDYGGPDYYGSGYGGPDYYGSGYGGPDYYGSGYGGYTTTHFSNQGSIDYNTVGICDGNNEYSVTSSGSFQSPNYPNMYPNDASCTNKFTTSFDGITFEVNGFYLESCCDSLTFSDNSGDYPFTGQIFNGTRFSFSSSNVIVSFTTDYSVQRYGFHIDVIDGYDPSNDISYVHGNLKFDGESPQKEIIKKN